jgi:hypothetical protein
MLHGSLAKACCGHRKRDHRAATGNAVTSDGVVRLRLLAIGGASFNLAPPALALLGTTLP